ncbi:MAG TPA: protein kinase [Polyangiaceae bacterium]|nr:protein kinase [Polyangiaceae bacterium]
MFDSGALIDGKYRIVKRLASGGMGVVYLAHHERLDRQVALKILLPERATRELGERFRREVRALARIHSPYVAQAYDADLLPTGEWFLVMEYLQGRDLRNEISSRGALSTEEAVTFVCQASRGAAAAHKVGIVHRDLKPQNLFVTELENSLRIKLVDFGIARELNAADPALTEPDLSLGTPLYMSPEQILTPFAIDARTDVWALGVILYELLAGFPAFSAATPGGILLAITSQEPRPLREVNAQIPPELVNVIERCLQKDPNARPATACELAELLAPFTISEERLKQLAAAVARREEPLSRVPLDNAQASALRSQQGGSRSAPVSPSPPTLDVVNNHVPDATTLTIVATVQPALEGTKERAISKVLCATHRGPLRRRLVAAVTTLAFILVSISLVEAWRRSRVGTSQNASSAPLSSTIQPHSSAAPVATPKNDSTGSTRPDRGPETQPTSSPPLSASSVPTTPASAPAVRFPRNGVRRSPERTLPTRPAPSAPSNNDGNPLHL